jgi:hypothetical protein
MLADNVITAKVDTGADMCSLHAEHIALNENEKTVTFECFGKKYKAWYKHTMKIKNANGDDHRAVLILNVVVDDAMYENVEITLADRSAMSNEFLVGRKLLEQMNATIKVDHKEEE